MEIKDLGKIMEIKDLENTNYSLGANNNSLN
jgi:hypothetical protein